jgi:hypothetical protein
MFANRPCRGVDTPSTACCGGWTSSSYWVQIEVYETAVPGVSVHELSAATKRLRSLIWWHDSQLEPAIVLRATVVPWLGAPSVTTSSTSSRRSGHHRSAHRGSSPPWLCPRTCTRSPLRAAMSRTAWATYSAEAWMSLSARSGRRTVHTPKPRLARSGASPTPSSRRG